MKPIMPHSHQLACCAGGCRAGAGWAGRPGLVRLGRQIWAFGLAWAGRRVASAWAGPNLEGAWVYGAGWAGMGLICRLGLQGWRGLTGLAPGWDRLCWLWLYPQKKNLFTYKIKKIVDIHWISIRNLNDRKPTILKGF